VFWDITVIFGAISLCVYMGNTWEKTWSNNDPSFKSKWGYCLWIFLAGWVLSEFTGYFMYRYDEAAYQREQTGGIHGLREHERSTDFTYEEEEQEGQPQNERSKKKGKQKNDGDGDIELQAVHTNDWEREG